MQTIKVFLLPLVLSIILPHNSFAKEQCGIESCHGTKIVCGPNVPDACNLMYMMGDNCRRYAHCEVVEGKCQVIKDIKFDACVACVDKCAQEYQENLPALFECEGKCRQPSS